MVILEIGEFIQIMVWKQKEMGCSFVYMRVQLASILLVAERAVVCYESYRKCTSEHDGKVYNEAIFQEV